VGHRAATALSVVLDTYMVRMASRKLIGWPAV
jgi:hypothetical protein